MKNTPLGRYTWILEILAIMPRGAVLARIAEIMDVTPGTAHRLLGALCDVGLVERNDSNKTYFLGPRMRRLCQISLPSADLASLARLPLRFLSDSFQKTAFLARLVGHRVEIVAAEVPEDASSGYVVPGRVMAPHAAATAKAIMAFQQPEMWDEVLAGDLPRLASGTETDPRKVREGYRLVAQRGYATCVNEVDPSVQSFAVPVRNSDGQVLYSIGISGFLHTFDDYPVETVIARMRETARIIGRHLDHNASPEQDTAGDRAES